MLYLSLKGMKYGPLAKYLSLGAAANILGVVVYSLSVLNITAASFLAEYSMKIAVIVEFFLLSIGITHKIKNYAVTQVLASILSHEVRSPLDKFDRVLKRISNAKDEKLKQYL